MITIKGNDISVTTEEEREAIFKVMEKFDIRFEHEGEEVMRIDAEGPNISTEWEKCPEEVKTRQQKLFEGGAFEVHGVPCWNSAPDPRYNTPKEKPKFSQEEIDAVIGGNPIYKEVKLLLNDAQREQVGYGMGKYPEPLNDETWGVIETLDHIISEDIDKLHYTVMLKVKLMKLLKMIGGEKR